ncbi:hypothetical protein [Lysinibacillus fusiformis]
MIRFGIEETISIEEEVARREWSRMHRKTDIKPYFDEGLYQKVLE